MEPRRTELVIREPQEEPAVRHGLSEVSTTPSVQVQTDQVGTRFVDREVNTSIMDVRPTEREERTNILQTHNIGIQVPSASSELSRGTTDETDFMARFHVPARLPQLDGPTSVSTKRKQFVPIVQR